MYFLIDEDRNHCNKDSQSMERTALLIESWVAVQVEVNFTFNKFVENS